MNIDAMIRAMVGKRKKKISAMEQRRCNAVLIKKQIELRNK
jgi:hypothetical protein